MQWICSFYCLGQWHLSGFSINIVVCQKDNHLRLNREELLKSSWSWFIVGVDKSNKVGWMVTMASGGHIFLLKVSRHFNSLQADGFVRWFNLCNGARLTKKVLLFFCETVWKFPFGKKAVPWCRKRKWKVADPELTNGNNAKAVNLLTHFTGFLCSSHFYIVKVTFIVTL